MHQLLPTHSKSLLVPPAPPQGDNKGFWVCKKKMGTGGEALCRFQHAAFKEFYDVVRRATLLLRMYPAAVLAGLASLAPLQRSSSLQTNFHSACRSVADVGRSCPGPADTPTLVQFRSAGRVDLEPA